MKTYVLACQKGGVAKTTTAYTLANGLVNKGYKVLAIDLDPQCNLSQTANIDVLEADITIYEVLKGTADIRKAIQSVKINLDMIAGSLNLVGADMEFTQTGREFLLQDALEVVQAEYDFCVIDTAPHMGILTINALTAANSAIIPITADIYAIQGLAQLQKLVIEPVKKRCNKGLNISGLLLTRYSDRTNTTKAIMASVEQYATALGTKVFNTKIREAVAIRESQLIKSDIFEDYTTAEVTKDYKQFINELLESEE